MAKNITTGVATDIVNDCERIRIVVNAALTGSIIVVAGVTTIATITNPAVGNNFNYGGLTNLGKVVVTPSTTCDITVTVDPKI